MNRIEIYGKGACQCQADSLPMIEARLKEAGLIKNDLSGLITQGAYSSHVKASAKTHWEGGAWDVKAALVNSADKRRIWRECGVAMWFRPAAEGPWPDHGHGVWIGCPHLHAQADAQVADYRKGRNGLKGHAADQGPKVAFITWADALAGFSPVTRAAAVAAVAAVAPAPVVDPIPRTPTPKPWPEILEDGDRGSQTLKRLQMQLSVKVTGELDHFTVRALKVWLGNPDDGRGVLSRENVMQLQFRVGFRGKARDGDWGPVTTKALQVFLNANR